MGSVSQRHVREPRLVTRCRVEFERMDQRIVAESEDLSRNGVFVRTEELLPVISFNAKASADEQQKHEDFVNRMVAKGYTTRQVRLLCDWYLRVRKSS